jgi:putative transcriptional regulator
MHPDGSLTNQLLIAMPGMLDPNFSTTVTLVCEHNDEGALGIVINRPTTLQLRELFEQLSVDDADAAAAENPVLAGGPVGMERGFVLHGPEYGYESTLEVSNEIRLTLSRDIIEALAAGQGPAPVLVALGYAGWGAGQLEEEMLANAWLSVPATREIVFETPFADRWNTAARSLGIDITAMPTEAGHA